MLLARVPVLLSLADTHFPFEVFSGSVAQALLDGVHPDLAPLTIVSHVRGGPLFGLLAAPLFALFGPGLLVLKLVPLLWHAAGVGLLVAVMGRLVDRSAAIATAALFVCAPPLLAKLSVMAFASHLESATIMALGLYVALPIVERAGALRRSWLAVGLVTGFAAFFHLQALLGALLLLALLLVLRPRDFLRATPLLALGTTLLALPSLLFDGGHLELLQGMVGKSAGRSPSLMALGPGGETTVYGTDKLVELFSRGLGPTLEFGPVGGPPWHGLANGYALALLAAGLLALLGLRRAWLARPWLRAEGSLGMTAYLPLHAAGLAFAFFTSGMPWDLWYSGTGMENRRIALVLVSLLAFAAVGVRASAPRGLRLACTGLVTLLCALGLVGVAPVAAEAGRASSINRGEAFEWFVPHLASASDGDLSGLLDTIERTDRGDPRFRSLRFRVSALTPPPNRDPAEAVVRARQTRDPARRLLALTHVGRAIGNDKARVEALPDARWLASLDATDRVALLHGVGLGLARKQPAARERVDVLDPWIGYVAFRYRGPALQSVLEGFGFAVGQVHDPYNRLMRDELPSWAALPDGAREAFYRGLGWGFRQRFLVPPDAVSPELRVLADLPEALHPAFLEGLLGQRLPAEASVLAPPPGG